MCPKCNKPCFYDDIYIKNYYVEIVTSSNLADCSETIELVTDGTWKVFRDHNKHKNLESSADDKEKPIDTVNLDDSSDDNPIEFKKEINVCVKKEFENLISCFIDLTLDDNKDDPTKKDKEENEAQVFDVQPITIASDTLTQVLSQQVVSSSAQVLVIELDGPSPLVTSTLTTTA